MTYTRKENDEAFRIVNINASEVPPFRKFDNVSQRVEYGNYQVVEVLDCSGNTTVVYDHSKTVCIYSCLGNKLTVTTEVPLQHLWVRKIGSNGIDYKFPEGVVERNAGYSVYIPAGAYNVELKGDKYFEAVYDIQLNK